MNDLIRHLNDLIRQQILADYKELLSSGAGRRVLGSIFYDAHLNMLIGWPSNELTAAYDAGRRDLALRVANKVREVEPMGVAKCEVEYQNMIETYERSEDDGRDEWDAGGTD